MRGPKLAGDALDAVQHRGSHLQIIAAAGSGKTEVVAQRVAALLAEGVPPDGIVAFTFTERAAAELRQRISERVEDRLGHESLDALTGLFVGTIHSYCFRLLQTQVPRYATYEVLDDHQLTAFLAREANRLDLRQLDQKNRLFGSIQRFLQGVGVIENELLDATTMPDPFRSVALDYFELLDRYRLLTFGQQVAKAVHELSDANVADKVTATLQHLIVDEYQDVNPAQELLIKLLAGAGAELCVVGDDDQAIYQWRGSDVENIITFASRYPGVATFKISTNRRSRPQIIDASNRFASTIPHRLPKSMASHRSGVPEAEVVAWDSHDELSEAERIASLASDLNRQGVPFRDIAVLVRGRVSYPALLERFRAWGIPVQPGGRTGLFDQPEAQVLGRAIAWMTEIEWRQSHQRGALVEETTLLRELELVFSLSGPALKRVRHVLHQWRDAIPRKDRSADLVGEFYEVLGELGVNDWGFSSTIATNRLGTLARFTSLLADFEMVRQRARPDSDVLGEQVGGQDRGDWYYKNLAIHIMNYAQGAYDGFDGEADFDLDAVELTTIHRSKGLEWPVVFVPSMTARRFPSSRTGEVQNWIVPRHRFPAARYEGSDAEERRLFYVAMTRARDWLSVSSHRRIRKQAATPSPYFDELAPYRTSPDALKMPEVESSSDTEGVIELTYSELASFIDCGMAYRLRNLVGFQPRLAPELGYGKAVHHVLRTVAERTREVGTVPSANEIDQILDTSFFLPSANRPAFRQLKDAARRLVTSYAFDHAADLHRVWESERPFKLHLDGITVSGRADVVFDQQDERSTELAILDFKTSAPAASDDGLQLQVYADAAQREGLDIRGAYVHDLNAGKRSAIDISDAALAGAEATVAEAAVRLRARDYEPVPGKRCRRCEVRTVCGSAII